MDIEALRADTPGCANRVHLNNAGAALMSRQTLAAMTGHLELEAQIGGYEAAAAAGDAIDATYQNLAELVGGSDEEIALFDNSTHAWNAAFYSVPLKAGDRILTGRDEYGSNVLAYWQVARRTGAEVVVIDNDDTGQIDLAALADAIDDRTRLIGLTYVPTGGGLVNPAAEVGRLARSADVMYLLDATQAVGQFPVDVDRTRLRPAHRHRPEVPEGSARHRVPLGPLRRPRPAGPVRRGDPLSHLGRRPGLHLG